jgi:Mce-associated membrane protein
VTRDNDADIETKVDDTDARDVEDTSDEVSEPLADETRDEHLTDAHVTDGTASPDVAPARSKGRLRRLLLPVALAVILLASAGVTTWVYFAQYRPDQAVNDAVKTRVIQSASDATVALLSYAPDTLDKDFANAKTRLTGDFLNYYTQFTAEIVTPAAKQKAVKTSAAVVRSAVSQLQPTSAEVLLFINQTTTSKENPGGSFTSSSVKVGLTRSGNDWLISSFDPV